MIESFSQDAQNVNKQANDIISKLNIIPCGLYNYSVEQLYTAVMFIQGGRFGISKKIERVLFIMTNADFTQEQVQSIGEVLVCLEKIKHLEIPAPTSPNFLAEIVQHQKDERYPLKRDLRKEITALAIVLFNELCKDDYNLFQFEIIDYFAKCVVPNFFKGDAFKFAVVGSYGFIMHSLLQDQPAIKQLGQDIWEKGTDIDLKLIFDNAQDQHDVFNEIRQILTKCIETDKSTFNLHQYIGAFSENIKSILKSSLFQLQFQNQKYKIVPNPEYNLIISESITSKQSVIPVLKSVQLHDKALTGVPGLILSICHIQDESNAIDFIVFRFRLRMSTMYNDTIQYTSCDFVDISICQHNDRSYLLDQKPDSAELYDYMRSAAMNNEKN